MSGEDFHLTVVCAHRRTSLRSPNAINKFAFALGDRKLLAGCLYLFLLPHSGRCRQVADPGHAPVIRRGASASGLAAFRGNPSYRTAGNPAGSICFFFLPHVTSLRSPTCPSKLLSVVGTQETNSPLRSEIAIYRFYSGKHRLTALRRRNEFRRI